MESLTLSLTNIVLIFGGNGYKTNLTITHDVCFCIMERIFVKFCDLCPIHLSFWNANKYV